jgi:ABC-type proline/glycine betaine transport system permease subunit
MKGNTNKILNRIRIQKWIELGIASIGVLIGIGLGIWILIEIVQRGIQNQ